MGDVADYVAGLDSPAREAVAHVYDIARRLAPDAVEGTSYGMAALRASGKPLIAVTARRGHLSLHPFSSEVVEAVAAGLPGFSLSKGTIRFSAHTPVPDAVVERIVRLRLAEIAGA